MLLAALAMLASTSAHADTFIVDIVGEPGADFENVQQAVDSPLVKNGDRLLVRPGTYPRFTSTKGVAILGLGFAPEAVVFTSASSGGGMFWFSFFTDCAAPIRVNNVSFTAPMNVTRCRGPVHLLNVEADVFAFDEVLDVRVENASGNNPIYSRVEVTNQTRAEFLGCNFTAGMEIDNQSTVRIANTELRGQKGSDVEWAFECCGGPGGSALRVKGSSSVELIGAAGDILQGGLGGWGWDVFSDGKGGAGLIVEAGSSARVSNYELIGGFDPEHTFQTPDYVGSPSDLTTPLLPDPLLTRTGGFLPGQVATFTVQGPPGSLYYLFGGTTSLTATLPGVIGMLSTQLTYPLAYANLDGVGHAAVNLTLPLGLPEGFLATVQSGLFYTADSSVRLTNPATVVVE